MCGRRFLGWRAYSSDSATSRGPDFRPILHILKFGGQKLLEGNSLSLAIGVLLIADIVFVDAFVLISWARRKTHNPLAEFGRIICAIRVDFASLGLSAIPMPEWLKNLYTQRRIGSLVCLFIRYRSLCNRDSLRSNISCRALSRAICLAIKFTRLDKKCGLYKFELTQGLYIECQVVPCRILV